MVSTPLEILRKVFGYDTFRGAQDAFIVRMPSIVFNSAVSAGNTASGWWLAGLLLGTACFAFARRRRG